jgi:hypothetical protein
LVFVAGVLCGALLCAVGRAEAAEDWSAFTRCADRGSSCAVAAPSAGGTARIGIRGTDQFADVFLIGGNTSFSCINQNFGLASDWHMWDAAECAWSATPYVSPADSSASSPTGASSSPDRAAEAAQLSELWALGAGVLAILWISRESLFRNIFGSN